MQHAQTTAGAKTVRLALALVCFGAAAWCLFTFHVVGAEYRDWRIPQLGVQTLPEEELHLWVWYLVYGVTAVWLLTSGLVASSALLAVRRVLRALAANAQLPMLLVLLAVLLALGVRQFVLEGQVLTDDETTYVFIARTLLAGHVVNPASAAAEFLHSQFIISDERGRFGMYPIGHPLVLALGLLLHVEGFIAPVLAGVTAWLTYQLGVRLFGRRRSVIALVLLALSPHFTWTHATLLSQTTTTCALMAGLLAAHRLRESGGLRWAALAGLAAGVDVLARPVPGGAHALLIVGALWVWAPKVTRGRAAVLAWVPITAAVLVTMAVNAAQSGDPLRSAYYVVIPGTGPGVASGVQNASLSLFGALLRENFWLFGWPLSFFAVPFARARRGWVLWGVVGAAVAYRLGVPKTVVSTTGPIYMTEAVPALALLSADGLGRLGVLARRLRWPRGLWAGVVVASYVVTAALFVPVQGGALRLAAVARLYTTLTVDEVRAQRPVIFATTYVDPAQAATWAYFPPAAGPALDDEVIFLRWPATAPEVQRGYQAWKRQWPERPAYLLKVTPEPSLVALPLLELPAQ